IAKLKFAESFAPTPNFPTNRRTSHSIYGGESSMSNNHGKKTTIHVTNIVRDKADLKALFSLYEGFRRISFHQDYVFVCFSSVDTSTKAIDRIHSESEMLAAYAKHGVASNTTPSISVPPNPILYVSVFPYFTEPELIKIFRSYEGFDSCRFFPNHALVRFTNVEYSKRALEDLNGTTNLFANYSTKGAKSTTELRAKNSRGSIDHSSDAKYDSFSAQYSEGPSGTSAPKCTIHVTNLDREVPVLLAFFKSLDGFKRVAFYIDYAFVIFEDPHYSSMAIEEILFGTKMKASFAKAEYSPHCIPANTLGTPNAIIRVSDYPASMTDAELEGLFETFDGFQDIVFYHSSCLVHFRDVFSAQTALEELNAITNFTAIFSRKGAASMSSNIPPTAATTIPQPAIVPTAILSARPTSVTVLSSSAPSAAPLNTLAEFPAFPVAPSSSNVTPQSGAIGSSEILETSSLKSAKGLPSLASSHIVSQPQQHSQASHLQQQPLFGTDSSILESFSQSPVPTAGTLSSSPSGTHSITFGATDSIQTRSATVAETGGSPLVPAQLQIALNQNGNGLSPLAPDSTSIHLSTSADRDSEQTAADSDDVDDISPASEMASLGSQFRNGLAASNGGSSMPDMSSRKLSPAVSSTQSVDALAMNGIGVIPNAVASASVGHQATQGLDVNQPPFFPASGGSFFSKVGAIGSNSNTNATAASNLGDALSGATLENRLWSTKSFLDAMFHRIVTLEAENDALRRREAENQQHQQQASQQRLSPFGSTTAFGFGSGAFTHHQPHNHYLSHQMHHSNLHSHHPSHHPSNIATHRSTGPNSALHQTLNIGASQTMSRTGNAGVDSAHSSSTLGSTSGSVPNGTAPGATPPTSAGATAPNSSGSPSESMPPGSALIAAAAEAHDSASAAAVAAASVASGAVDWKQAYERAVDEIEILRAELDRRNAEYERLESAHKNCGYLQGLLAICD
ncbi:hypothetical protein HDU96_002357, partial [Phlyctochytrium bullatum]